MKPPAHHLQAVAQWRREVEDQIPGLKVSNFPSLFRVYVRKQRDHPITAHIIDGKARTLVSNKDRWHEIPEALKRDVGCFQKGWLPPKDWNYEAIAEFAAPGEEPHHLDLSNPRLYSLKGWQVPRSPLQSEGVVTLDVVQEFKERLGVLFQLVEHGDSANPPNKRRDRIMEFLDHHNHFGDNQQAFRDFIGEIASNPNDLPPPPTWSNILNEAQGGKRAALEKPEGLAGLLREWLADAREATTSAKGTDKVKSTRPDLKLLALVHALRYLTDDKGADITQANAQALAIDAGSKGKDAGRDLRRHYERYTMGKDQHAQRLDDRERHTVKRRYLGAIAMLEEHPKAKAMAEAELEELRERE